MRRLFRRLSRLVNSGYYFFPEVFNLLNAVVAFSFVFVFPYVRLQRTFY